MPGRLVGLTAVLAGMAMIGSTLLLPAAFGAREAVDTVDDTVLDVPALPDDIDPLAQTSFVVSRHGRPIGELHGPVDRVPVPLRDVPMVVREAVLATEDADFYRHSGVDHRAILRAAVTNVQEGRIEEGASTITQQYVRNVLLSPERSFERKINEALWAVELEQRLTKDEILERYLNTAYYGNGVYGIGTASAFYFGKPVTELGVAEAALLAGLIRAPEENDPVDRPDAARARRDIVVSQMRRTGSISDDEARTARSAPLGLRISPDPPSPAPFFVEYVKRVAFDPSIDLQPDVQAALGDTPAERRRAVFEGGLTIHTSVDLRLDGLAQETLQRYLDDPDEDPLGALITVKPDDGAVLAMAIGPEQFGHCEPDDPDCDVTKLNPLVPGGGGVFGRQPGSSFKPFVVAAALDAGLPASWETETESGEVIEGCGFDEPYAPENYSERDRGTVDMYEGIENSVNVFAVKLAKEIGVLRVKDVAQRLGIRHSGNLGDFGPRDCSIALGTANVFPLEMAVAYATFANRGVRCAPFVITKIVDRDGDVVYEHDNDCQRVLSEDVAARVTDILQGPPSSGGTAPYVGATLDRPVAGKTGTTSNWVDAWFMGYVPQLVTAAWIGHETPRSMFGIEAAGTTWARVTGGSIPARLWADFMVAALEGSEPVDFDEPPPVPRTTVPDVEGLTVPDAVERLEAAGLRARPSPEGYDGRVGDQDPEPGQVVDEGTVVTLSAGGDGGSPSGGDGVSGGDGGGDGGGGGDGDGGGGDGDDDGHPGRGNGPPDDRGRD